MDDCVSQNSTKGAMDVVTIFMGLVLMTET
jgi:hypothetical protein